jgi:hypothetical protein
MLVQEETAISISGRLVFHNLGKPAEIRDVLADSRLTQSMPVKTTLARSTGFVVPVSLLP